MTKETFTREEISSISIINIVDTTYFAIPKVVNPNPEAQINAFNLADEAFNRNRTPEALDKERKEVVRDLRGIIAEYKYSRDRIDKLTKNHKISLLNEYKKTIADELARRYPNQGPEFIAQTKEVKEHLTKNKALEYTQEELEGYRHLKEQYSLINKVFLEKMIEYINFVNGHKWTRIQFANPRSMKKTKATKDIFDRMEAFVDKLAVANVYEKGGSIQVKYNEDLSRAHNVLKSPEFSMYYFQELSKDYELIEKDEVED